MSTVFWRLPFTSTTTASSPKSRLKSSVAFDTSEEGDTSVSVPALRLEPRGAARRRPRPSTATTTIGHERPPRDGAHDRCKSLSPHEGQLRELRSDRTQLRVHARLADQAAERRLRAARRGGRVGPVGVNTNCWICARSAGSRLGSVGASLRHGRAGRRAQVVAEQRQPARELAVGARAPGRGSSGWWRSARRRRRAPRGSAGWWCAGSSAAAARPPTGRWRCVAAESLAKKAAISRLYRPR